MKEVKNISELNVVTTIVINENRDGQYRIEESVSNCIKGIKENQAFGIINEENGYKYYVVKEQDGYVKAVDVYNEFGVKVGGENGGEVKYPAAKKAAEQVYWSTKVDHSKNGLSVEDSDEVNRLGEYVYNHYEDVLKNGYETTVCGIKVKIFYSELEGGLKYRTEYMTTDMIFKLENLDWFKGDIKTGIATKAKEIENQTVTVEENTEIIEKEEVMNTPEEKETVSTIIERDEEEVYAPEEFLKYFNKKGCSVSTGSEYRVGFYPSVITIEHKGKDVEEKEITENTTAEDVYHWVNKKGVKYGFAKAVEEEETVSTEETAYTEYAEEKYNEFSTALDDTQKGVSQTVRVETAGKNVDLNIKPGDDENTALVEVCSNFQTVATVKTGTKASKALFEEIVSAGDPEAFKPVSTEATPAGIEYRTENVYRERAIEQYREYATQREYELNRVKELKNIEEKKGFEALEEYEEEYYNNHRTEIEKVYRHWHKKDLESDYVDMIVYDIYLNKSEGTLNREIAELRSRIELLENPTEENRQEYLRKYGKTEARNDSMLPKAAVKTTYTNRKIVDRVLELEDEVKALKPYNDALREYIQDGIKIVLWNYEDGMFLRLEKGGKDSEKVFVDYGDRSQIAEAVSLIRSDIYQYER